MNVCRLTARRSGATCTAIGLAVAVQVLAPPPAVAGPSVWTIYGSRSASIDIALTRATTITTRSVTGSGRYAGIYLSRVANSGQVVDRLMIKSRAMFGTDDVVELGAEGALPAGQYRLTLITDAQATVRLTVSGAGARTLRPRVRSVVTVREAHASEHTFPESTLTRTGVTVSTDPVVVVSAMATISSQALDVHDLAACVVDDPSATCSGGKPTFGLGTRSVGSGRGVERITTYYTRDDLRSGRHTAVAEYRGPWRADLRLVTMTLTNAY